MVLPPGTLLQLMYLRGRLRRLPRGRFIEVGPGNGDVARLLLDHGWSGRSYDLDPVTVDALRDRFAREISDHRFAAVNEDYVRARCHDKADLIVSCMVMEHLPDDAQAAFMKKASEDLNENGIMIALVPASPAHWGIEDEIAGHCRRYTREGITALIAQHNWRLLHLAGLTFPVSNLLLPMSNFLVNRAERSRLDLSPLERTKLSGRREVAFKTRFPGVLKIFLNEYTLFPVHLLQRLCTRSKSALVLYFEARPCSRAPRGG